ncbi:MAG: cupin domain-containing protein, partial [Alphaproteobacteria bacterium]
RKSGATDPALGWKMTYLDPKTGKPPMNVMAAFLQLMPKGMVSVPYRSTDAAMFVVVEGKGRATVGNESWHVAPNDIFVAPSWMWHSFEADEELVLFSLSDRTIQQHLGFWREQRQY